MSIHLSCSCGERLKVADRFAGKRIRCPICGERLLVPDDEPIDAGFEFVEEASASDKSRIATRDRRAAGPPPRKRRLRKSRARGGEENPLVRMYMDQGRNLDHRERVRGLGAGAWARDDEGGWTIGWIHITAGVLGGVGMLLVGLLAMAFIGIFKNEIPASPRLFIGAVVCTAIGAIVLAKLVFFGQED